MIVTPAGPRSTQGNRMTAQRWSRILRDLGHRVSIRPEWRGEDADLLVALHAHRSAGSIRRFRRDLPDRPRIVALTGTDLYRDLHRRGGRVMETLRMADHIVALHPLASRELPPSLRRKVRVILQSRASPAGEVRRTVRTFDVCVLAHLRALKDPLRAARAARLLPDDSRVRVVHLGAALTPSMERQARREARENPRYRWLGEVSRGRALQVLRRCHLLVISSRMEGGANAVTESLVAGTPILASRIPGNVGLLGRDYPGYFPCGDTRALARLLRRAETDGGFLAHLRGWCRRRARAFHPAREKAAWRSLLGRTTARGMPAEVR